MAVDHAYVKQYSTLCEVEFILIAASVIFIKSQIMNLELKEAVRSDSMIHLNFFKGF